MKLAHFVAALGAIIASAQVVAAACTTDADCPSKCPVSNERLCETAFCLDGVCRAAICRAPPAVCPMDLRNLVIKEGRRKNEMSLEACTSSNPIQRTDLLGNVKNNQSHRVRVDTGRIAQRREIKAFLEHKCHSDPKL
ncbi:hypothetical protein CPB84DRAFT_1750665 [Gymnopilus junonius]|uniref:Uncharacterized protein n=1 Tax=Gymnopilus junonius TaxID=109634 RepID=A0A9P5NEE2_GYMJU|nr:hypothetical protein CPB84DRAFT_1750665 [Gymnopilus junonius]